MDNEGHQNYLFFISFVIDLGRYSLFLDLNRVTNRLVAISSRFQIFLQELPHWKLWTKWENFDYLSRGRTRINWGTVFRTCPTAIVVKRYNLTVPRYHRLREWYGNKLVNHHLVLHKCVTIWLWFDYSVQCVFNRRVEQVVVEKWVGFLGDSRTRCAECWLNAVQCVKEEFKCVGCTCWILMAFCVCGWSIRI